MVIVIYTLSADQEFHAGPLALYNQLRKSFAISVKGQAM